MATPVPPPSVPPPPQASASPQNAPSVGESRAPFELLPPNQTGVARAAEVIRAGKLAVLPTETVYGIAVNLHSPEARQAARALKGATPDSQKVPSADAAAAPWVLHVARPEDLLAWVPHLSPLGRRLVTKAVPGPVAFQIKLTAEDEAAARKRLGASADETIVENYLTIRCPDLSQTQDVLAAVAAPVAIIGAGSLAQPGVFEAQDLPESVLQSVHAPRVALDAGPTRYRRSSTLVRIDGESYSVVRTGVIDERIIQRLADLTVLFICSGNTCRSPMAAALAARQLADRLGVPPADLPLRHIMVQSAGLHASRGLRAGREAVDAVRAYGGDLSTHVSQPATPELLRRADVIYTMTDAHREEVLELVPGAERKTFRMDPEGDVADPIGASLSVYQLVASKLSTLLQKRLSEIVV